MNSADLQSIIDDLDFAQIFIPENEDEDKAVRHSLAYASEILTWLPDEIVEQIPHRNLIR